MPLFAVIRTRGSAWRESQPVEGQSGCSSQASFMTALGREKFVRRGGPREGSAEVLLIVKADTADEIHSRLGEDPWSRNDLLRIARITPWTLRLGSLG